MKSSHHFSSHYHARGPAQNKKVIKNNLLGEIVSLFDTKGNAIKQKQADANLEAIKFAEQQLAVKPATSVWVYVSIGVGVIVLVLGIVLLLKKKK